MWKTAKALVNPDARQNIPALTTLGYTANTNSEKGDLFAEHLRDRFRVNLRRKKQPSTDTTTAQSKKTITDYPTNDHLRLATPKIAMLLQDLSPKKAPGLDKITNAALKHLPNKQTTELTNIVNAILRLRSFPNTCKNARIIMIPKANKSRKEPNNYRPLLSSLEAAARAEPRPAGHTMDRKDPDSDPEDSPASSDDGNHSRSPVNKKPAKPSYNDLAEYSSKLAEENKILRSRMNEVIQQNADQQRTINEMREAQKIQEDMIRKLQETLDKVLAKVGNPVTTPTPKPDTTPASTPDTPMDTSVPATQRKRRNSVEFPPLSKKQPPYHANPSQTKNPPVQSTKCATSPAQPGTSKEHPPEPTRPVEPTPNPAPASTPTPDTKERVPPVIIRSKSNWVQVSASMKTRQIHYTSARNTEEGIRIQPSSTPDYRNATRFLDGNRIPYHSFQLKEERNLHVVLKGIPESLDAETVAEELQVLGYHPSKLFGHNQGKCPAPPKCVKCGAGHRTEICKKSKNTPDRCANCRGDHTANARICPSRPPPKIPLPVKAAAAATSPNPNRPMFLRRSHLPSARPKPESRTHSRTPTSAGYSTLQPAEIMKNTTANRTH
ncbi:proteoglycan 4-like [Cylas formicarius]|uniref:proteoglycan 4-like n=1 Tax=Cylas formicarius TaxID=197179 RepID=UPI002958450E|nr:proteoglycan 4-like [Cylas formicarius]